MLAQFTAVFLLHLTAAADSDLIVLHKGDSSLGFYSPDGKLKSKVKLNQHPHEMVFSPDRSQLYITENGTMRIENIAAGGNSVAIVDLKNRKKVATVSTGSFRRPHGIDFAAGSVFVSTEAPDRVLRVDLKTRKVAGVFEGVGRIAHMVTVSHDGKTAYASNAGSGTVAIVDLASKQTRTVAVGKRPEGSVLSPDGRELFVANRESAEITVIDTAKGEAVGRIATGNGPVRIGITPDGSTLVYALMHDHAIGFADAKARREMGTVKVEGSPVSLHLSSDGARAFAASEEIDAVHIVSVPERKLIRTFKTPQGYAPDPVSELP